MLLCLQIPPSPSRARASLNSSASCQKTACLNNAGTLHAQSLNRALSCGRLNLGISVWMSKGSIACHWSECTSTRARSDEHLEMTRPAGRPAGITTACSDWERLDSTRLLAPSHTVARLLFSHAPGLLILWGGCSASAAARRGRAHPRTTESAGPSRAPGPPTHDAIACVERAHPLSAGRQGLAVADASRAAPTTRARGAAAGQTMPGGGGVLGAALPRPNDHRHGP